MKTYPRIYENILREHLSEYRQMAFLSGPRQVGKTTLAKTFSDTYLNWDEKETRQLVIKGAKAVGTAVGFESRDNPGSILAFDEIHRYSKWKTFLKGFFDLYEDRGKIIATGSARMDVYKRGGDSMMGRYFPYRVHPFSVAEIITPSLPNEKNILRSPAEVDTADWNALYEFGGFPEPFTMRNRRFLRKWQDLRMEQLLRQDIRDITRSVELDQIEVLATILANRSGEQLVFAPLACDVTTSEPTVKKWISVLKSLYYGFTIQPYFRNIENSIRKTPKWYLRDWSGIQDEGKKFETFMACHLLKAVEGWTDLGLGKFDLRYIRDKAKREVDFVVVRDGKPWFLVEAKNGETKISEALLHFQDVTKADFAIQVVNSMPFDGQDSFAEHDPHTVSAKTFLSQLM